MNNLFFEVMFFVIVQIKNKSLALAPFSHSLIFALAFRPSFSGYHCEYKRRTGHKLDGCMVAFKKSRFSLFSSHPVEFFRQGIPILDRDNVGLIVLLKPAGAPGSDCNVCVVTTHLLYNPRRGDIKLAQLALLLAEVSRVARQSDGTTCPVLLCGDFNSVPASPLYTFITDSRLEYAGMPIGKVRGTARCTLHTLYVQLLSNPVLLYF